MYITPVLFATYEIPPNLKTYLQWNPLYPVFAALEQIFTGQMPSTGYLLGGAAWALVACVGGSIIFLSREREFAVRL